MQGGGGGGGYPDYANPQRQKSKSLLPSLMSSEHSISRTFEAMPLT